MSANPLGDLLAEIGKLALFLIGLYYSWMVGFHGWVAQIAGSAASFLLVGLTFVVLPCVLVYVLVSYAVSSTYSVLEFSWSALVRIIVLLIVTFFVLFLLK